MVACFHHPQLPPTNNEAERALRHAVIARRISLDFSQVRNECGGCGECGEKEEELSNCTSMNAALPPTPPTPPTLPTRTTQYVRNSG
uniref:transposase n=1 Tax=Nostoc flagelliforme TaxID=1306274 RepID=UPI0021F232B3|nr:transposase [Nostoc flagelliforme]